MSIDTKNYDPVEMAQGGGIQRGSGAPSHSASKGTLYINLGGTTTNDRAYLNTDGATTWTALTTAA